MADSLHPGDRVRCTRSGYTGTLRAWPFDVPEGHAMHQRDSWIMDVDPCKALPAGGPASVREGNLARVP